MASEEIINILGWKSLEERRVAHVKSLVVKCIEGNVPDLYNDYLRVKCSNIHRSNTRNNDKLFINRIKLEATKRAFFFIKEQLFLTLDPSIV